MNKIANIITVFAINLIVLKYKTVVLNFVNYNVCNIDTLKIVRKVLWELLHNGYIRI